jgi:hypothetical protein
MTLKDELTPKVEGKDDSCEVAATATATEIGTERTRRNEIDDLLRRSTQYQHSYSDQSPPSNTSTTGSTFQLPPPLHLPAYTDIAMLDLGNCALSSLPVDMPMTLSNLKILFLSNNNFVEIPKILSEFHQLEMVAFKNNQMKSIHPHCFTPQTMKLRWIILTNNCIAEIPDTIGHCANLQKFMLSGNCITSLPCTIDQCTKLELVRLACNQLVAPPNTLLKLPHLKWIALGGNPFLQSVSTTTSTATSTTTREKRIDTEPRIFTNIDETVGTILGRGASGITRAITVPELGTVAIKAYHSDTITSDGTPELERHIAIMVSQIQQQQQQQQEQEQGRSTSSKTGFIHVHGQCDTTRSLVMEYLIDYSTIADPPSFESCTRDVYTNTNPDHQKWSSNDPDHQKWSSNDVLHFVNVLLDSLRLLHRHGITHGDLYGHNILLSYCKNTDNDTKNTDDVYRHSYPSINVRLSDFGASFMYDTTSEYGENVQRIELRAFQVLLQEVSEHYYSIDIDNVEGPSASSRSSTMSLLKNLIAQCNVVTTFDELHIYQQQQQLKGIAEAFSVGLSFE